MVLACNGHGAVTHAKSWSRCANWVVDAEDTRVACTWRDDRRRESAMLLNSLQAMRLLHVCLYRNCKEFLHCQIAAVVSYQSHACTGQTFLIISKLGSFCMHLATPGMVYWRHMKSESAKVGQLCHAKPLSYVSALLSCKTPFLYISSLSCINERQCEKTACVLSCLGISSFAMLPNPIMSTDLLKRVSPTGTPTLRCCMLACM